MKYKIRTLAIICLFMVLSGLCGCKNKSSGQNGTVFAEYDLGMLMPEIEYRISNLTESVTVYFPVVTNKEITATELGGVAAKLPLTKDNIKVTLHSMLQDKLNYPYQNKYISFLKYQVYMENEELLQVNDIVTLFDTTLWIYHNSEFQKIQIDEDYLQITVVDREEEKVLPDWNRIIANLRAYIEFELANKED